MHLGTLGSVGKLSSSSGFFEMGGEGPTPSMTGGQKQFWIYMSKIMAIAQELLPQHPNLVGHLTYLFPSPYY